MVGVDNRYTRKIRKSRETKGLSGGPSTSSFITGARNQLPGLQLGVIWKEPALPELPQPGQAMGAKGGLGTLPQAPCLIDLRRCPAQCLQWEPLFLNVRFTKAMQAAREEHGSHQKGRAHPTWCHKVSLPVSFPRAAWFPLLNAAHKERSIISP